jgi:hypothetical protein
MRSTILAPRVPASRAALDITKNHAPARCSPAANAVHVSHRGAVNSVSFSPYFIKETSAKIR